MKALILLTTAGLLAVSTSVLAEEIRPGLWEFTQQMQMDGQPMPGMQQMMQQMNSLPPEQRQMMEQMMAAQGVKMGQQGVQVCFGADMAQKGEMPMPQQDGCTHEVTERGSGKWKFRYQCPDSQGEGETEFISDREFTSRMHGTQQEAGRQRSLQMEHHARWVADDCGMLKPMQQPGKQ